MENKTLKKIYSKPKQGKRKFFRENQMGISQRAKAITIQGSKTIIHGVIFKDEIQWTIEMDTKGNILD